MIRKIMNLADVENEIVELGKSPLAEKAYPIPSYCVPLTDVLAILTRFRKHWTQFRPPTNTKEAELISEILGESRGFEHVNRRSAF